jgi:serine/threonine protein kinase/tetratricopeptide (TPR) repeat protein
MRTSEPIPSSPEDSAADSAPAADSGPELPDLADVGAAGISSSHAYLAGFAKLFPKLPSARLSIQQYTLDAKLGAGAMGVVYSATDARLGRKVALKVVRAAGDGQARARLLREAKNLAQLSHPHIVQIYEAGEHHGEVFIAMEFIEGHSLRAWMADKKPGLHAVLDALIDAGRGLAAAHAKGIIHRDIKPENILVGKDGRARVADFGVAASEQSHDTTLPRGRAPTVKAAAGTLTQGAGTPGYMSPEQHRHADLDARSDVFGFCVVVWEAVHGVHPFAGATADELRDAICAGRVIAPPKGRKAPARLEKLLRRGLATRREDRPGEMATVIAELVRVRYPRSPLSLLAVPIVGAVAIGATYAATVAPAVCSEVDHGLAAVWSERSGAALLAATPSIRREATTKLAGALDEFAGALLEVRKGLCVQHSGGLLTPRAYERALACVDERQAELESQARVLQAAKGGVLALTPMDVADARTRLARCSDPEYQAAGIDPPDAQDAAALAEITRLRGLGEAGLQGGEFVAAAASFEEAVTRARAVDYAPVTAAALYDAGRTYLRLRRGDEAIAALREARLLADGAREPFLAADASLLLLNAAVASNKFEEAEWFVRETEARLLQTGRGEDGARGELELSRADLLITVGRVAEAELALQRARDLLTAHGSVGGLWRFIVPRLEAQLAERRGSPGEALAAIERAWEELERLTGSADHPLYAEERGRYQRLAGDVVAAEASLTLARDNYAEVFGPDSVHVAGVLVLLARVYEQQRRFDEMRDAATRADEILKALPGEPMTLDDRVAVAGLLGARAAAERRYADALAHYDASWRALAASRAPDEGLMSLATNAAELRIMVEPRDLAGANQAIAAALTRLEESPAADPRTAVFVRRVAAEVARETGDCVQARRQAAAAEALLPAIRDRETIARVNYVLATVWGVGDPRTKAWIDRAAAIFEELGRPADVAEVRGFARGIVNNNVNGKCGTDRAAL